MRFSQIAAQQTGHIFHVTDDDRLVEFQLMRHGGKLLLAGVASGNLQNDDICVGPADAENDQRDTDQNRNHHQEPLYNISKHKSS